RPCRTAFRWSRRRRCRRPGRSWGDGWGREEPGGLEDSPGAPKSTEARPSAFGEEHEKPGGDLPLGPAPDGPIRGRRRPWRPPPMRCLVSRACYERRSSQLLAFFEKASPIASAMVSLKSLASA